MNQVRFAAALMVLSAGAALAQTASLTATPMSLSAAGGEVTLTASASYEGEPGALGWSIVLPATWTLASVAGPNVPAIVPKPGTTGVLEFAYTAVPPRRAGFVLVVRYPAGTPTTLLTSKALLRAGGKLRTLEPVPVALQLQ